MTDVAVQSLTAKESRLVDEFLIDLNGTAAAIRAGYSPKSANQIAAETLAKPSVAAEVARRQAELAKRTEITQDRVLREFWTVATADPNELVQFRRGACPKCWDLGIDDVEETLEPQPHGGALKRTRKEEPVLGLHLDQDPNPDCPDCGGEGQGRAFIADTRKLSPAAKRLYAGVKVTKNGIEVKMHDQMNALIQVGRHLGMFKDKVEITGTLTLEALVLESIKPKVIEGEARVVEPPADEA